MIVNSPCVKICKISAVTHLCVGCYRTLKEIQDWMYMTPSRRTEVLDEIVLRRIEFATAHDR